MKISEKLPQFNKRSLIIVTGSQVGEVYLAYKGEIEKLDNFKAINPKHSNKEGFFVRSGQGTTFGSGAVLEENKHKVTGEFLKQMKLSIEKIISKNEIDEFYLLFPDHIKNELYQNLSFDIQSKVVLFIDGNFTDIHPFDFLEKIKKEIDGRKTKVMSEEAMKILKKKE